VAKPVPQNTVQAEPATETIARLKAPAPVSAPKPVKDPKQVTTAEKMEHTREKIAHVDGEIRRTRQELDLALGALKADVHASQTASAAALQSAIRRLEQEQSVDVAHLKQQSTAKVSQIEKNALVQQVRASNRVKEIGLKLRDTDVSFAVRRPVIASDRTTEDHLVPATQVREFVSVGTLIYPRAVALDRDLPEVAALAPFTDSGHIIIEAPSGASDQPDATLKAFLTSIVAQAYASAPAGQMVVTVFNPKSTKALAGFLPTGATTAGLLKILQPTQDSLEQALTDQLDLMVRAEASIGNHASMADLVRTTGQHEHQYRTLVILDGPNDWSTKAIKLLEKLMAAGAKSGLSVLLHRDPEAKAPDRIDVERLYSYASVVRRSGLSWSLTVKGVPSPVPIQPVAVVADSAQARLMSMVVKGAESGALPNIQFSELVDRTFGTTDGGIKITVGRKGTQNTEFVLGDTISNIQNVLIGGRAGSGKTNLLKVMIYSMAGRYPREELELFLLDFKEGGDFMPFVGGDGHLPLPNATVVSRDCDAEFGIATLRHFAREMSRRSNVTSDNGVSNIWDLRKKTGMVIPRWVLIIDEFQGLFAGPTNTEATELLENFVRKGRSFGLHVVLATQTLSGVNFAGDKDKAIFENIAGRIALQLGPGEFTRFMQSGNDDGNQLRYRGQAIFNPASGAKSDNQLFVVARADADYTDTLQDELHQHAITAGATATAPFVYRGGEMVSVAQLVRSEGKPSAQDGNLQVWFGRQSTIDAGVAATNLSPIAGSHILLLGGDERTMPSAIATLQAAVLSAVASADEPPRVLILEQLIPQFRRDALADQWLETLGALGARVVLYDADTVREFLAAVSDASETRRRTVVALLGAENTDFKRIADDGDLWKSLIREMPRRNVNVIGHWTDLRDIPGDKYALKDDYKTMLIFGKNELLITDATNRPRYDLPPLQNNRTVVFSAAASQDGITTVASISRLTRADLTAFRAFGRGPVLRVETEGAPTPMFAAPTPPSKPDDPRATDTPTDNPVQAATPVMPVTRLGDVIMHSGESTAPGIQAVLGLSVAGPVELIVGGPVGAKHVLIAGSARTGVAQLLLSVLHSMAARHPADELRIDLVDSLEGGNFPELVAGSFPHLASVNASGEATVAEAVLDRYLNEMNRRRSLFDSKGWSTFEQFRATESEVMPRWVLVLNEYTEAFSAHVAAMIEAIAADGAGLGLHLVLAVLAPIDNVPGPGMLPIFAANSARLLAKMPEEESEKFLGTVQASTLERGEHALLASGIGKVGELFSIPKADDEEFALLRSELQTGGAS